MPNRFSMIDLHLHLLPAVDDGAATPAVAREMLVLARRLGFELLVATPHLEGPLTPEYRAKVSRAWSEVAPSAASLGIEVALGYEIQLTPDLAQRLERGEPSTLAGGRAVLVELPFAGWPLFAEQSLFELQAAGFRPLLAHPERYGEAQRDPSRVVALAERGVALQVTFGSLVGLFGKRVQQLAERLLLEDAATVLASDAHSAGQRFETVGRGRARAHDLVGPERLRQLVLDNPRALLRDDSLPVPAPIVAGGSTTSGWRRRLRRLRGQAEI
jgi:protein-tyrosine phosphatase